ncbi:MAG: DUF2378 family protein [Myxococcaceae bacterium]
MEQLIYENAVEGLFVRGFGKRITPKLKAAMREAGLDLDAPLKTTYPGPVINTCSKLLREHLYAHEKDDLKAYTDIGSTTLDGFFDTVLGRAMASVLRIVGYERIIDRLPRQMASGSNYQIVTVKRVKPGEAEVHCSDCEPHPGINVGVFTRAFGHWFQAPNFVCVILKVDQTGCTYRLTWTPKS